MSSFNKLFSMRSDVTNSNFNLRKAFNITYTLLFFMFTKFFDRLNANPKKASKQPTSSRVKSPVAVTSHLNTQTRISSLSPPSSQNSVQYNFPQYSPTSITSKKISEPRRLNTTHNVQTTAPPSKFSEGQVRIVTTPLAGIIFIC